MGNLLNNIYRVLIWLRRIAYCRGFGVQSPSDYSFVRYVINEHWPYYAYDDLSHEFPQAKGELLRVAQLYFRISNFCQVDTIVDTTPVNDIFTRYLHEGCHHSQFVNSLDSERNFQLARLNISVTEWTEVDSLLSHADNQSVLLMEGIHKNPTAKRYWKRIADDVRTGVCFDLYDVGIVFFDKKRYKHCYTINF